MSNKSQESKSKGTDSIKDSVITEKSPELAAALSASDWDKARLIRLMDGFLDQCERMMRDDALSIKDLNSATLTVARIVRERKIIIDGYYEERAPLKQEEKLAADKVVIIKVTDSKFYEDL